MSGVQAQLADTPAADSSAGRPAEIKWRFCRRWRVLPGKIVALTQTILYRTAD